MAAVEFLLTCWNVIESFGPRRTEESPARQPGFLFAYSPFLDLITSL
jgi:hypothetical protein